MEQEETSRFLTIMFAHSYHMVPMTRAGVISEADPDFINVRNEEAPETTCHEDIWLTS
jgi:hypothetical protein